MSDQVVKSVGRVFQVLELFDEVQKPLTARDVGRVLNYPASSALALLKSMVTLGYLAFDRAELVYAPTLRVAALGRWIDAALYKHGSLTDLLESVRHDTGHAVTLSVQNDLEMQCIHVVHGVPFGLTVKPGDTIPLFRSANGLAALSSRPDSEIAKFVKRFNRRARPPEQKIDLAHLMSRILRVRMQGFTAGYDLFYPGVGTIAFPFVANFARSPVVLAVTGLSAELKKNEARIVGAVREILSTSRQATD